MPPPHEVLEESTYAITELSQPPSNHSGSPGPGGSHLGKVGEDCGSYPLPRVEAGVQPEHLPAATLPGTNLEQQYWSVLVRPPELLQLTEIPF